MSNRHDVLTMGRVSMDLYPTRAGSIIEVDTYARSLGGSATNVAVAAARLGHRAAVVTGVGADRPGRYVLHALEQFGVDASLVLTHPTLHTPLVLSELDPPEDPGLEFYREPSAPDLTISLDVPGVEEAVREARVLWVTGTGLSAEPSRRTTIDALRAHAATDDVHVGVRERVFDLDWRPSLWDDPSVAHGRYAEALEHATVVVGNRAEVAVALGLGDDVVDPAAAADSLLDRGARIAIVKLGGDGVLLASRADGHIIVPPQPVEVVCGLGAGDAFGGALCHGLLSELPLRDIGVLANGAGAWVAARLACADAMPTLDELREFTAAADTTPTLPGGPA